MKLDGFDLGWNVGTTFQDPVRHLIIQSWSLQYRFVVCSTCMSNPGPFKSCYWGFLKVICYSWLTGSFDCSLISGHKRRPRTRFWLPRLHRICMPPSSAVQNNLRDKTKHTERKTAIGHPNAVRQADDCDDDTTNSTLVTSAWHIEQILESLIPV